MRRQGDRNFGVFVSVLDQWGLQGALSAENDNHEYDDITAVETPMTFNVSYDRTHNNMHAAVENGSDGDSEGIYENDEWKT